MFVLDLLIEMIFLGIDYGRRRVGLALAINGIISPLDWLIHNRQTEGKTLKEIKRICRQENVEEIVVGMPRTCLANEVAAFARRLEEMVKLKINFVDEDLTSELAEEIVGWRDKGKVDKTAAALILQRFL